MPEYVELPPSAALRPWVACYWWRPSLVTAQPVTQRVLPDLCADVIFDVDRAEAFAVGTMTAPLLLTSAALPSYLGVRFHPGRASAFFRLPMHELTDVTAPIAAVRRIDAEPIAAAPSLAARVAAVERILLPALTGAREPALAPALARLAATQGRIAIDRLARELAISRQHLRRRFLDEVGIAPKVYARITRFRAALSAPRASWSALAADLGYTDQSHFIADFREFTGLTPSAFFARR